MEDKTISTNSRDLMYYLIILSKWKKFIAINVVGITLISIIISFILPRWYQSSGTLLPPKNPNPLGALGFTQGNISKQFNPLRSLGSMMPNQDVYNYLAILKSRNLLENIVIHFDLMKIYGLRKNAMGEAIEELKLNMEFTATEEGTLQISIIDKDKNRAAEMVNFSISLLDELNRDLSAKEAKSNREFIEQRTQQNIELLNQSEENIKQFQEKNGLIVIPEQTSSSITALADLYAIKTIKELELQILKKTVSQDNYKYEATALELSELNKKLKDIPSLSNSYFKLYRDYLIQKKLFETLVPLLEQAKIEEKRDTPTLLVLDKAIPAEQPKLPRKKIIVIIFFFISLISSISIVIIVDKIERIKLNHPGEFLQLTKLWTNLIKTK
jgi:tyrosine-protein kinase Etk/Wzc